MSIKWNRLGVTNGPSPTFLNNNTTPITADDIGKPVKVNSANGKDLILCSADDPVFMILQSCPRNTDANGNATDLVVATAGCWEVPYTGSAPDPTSATPFVKADGSGGVTAHTAHLGAICIAVDTAASTCWIMLT